MKAAVTGGSGVVGSALVRHLVGGGHDVVALARSVESADKLRSIGADVVSGDVNDSASLDSLMRGAGWVFHVAGLNELCPRDRRRMWEVNVEGTRSVIAACRQAGASRLIHTSSATTIGQREGEVGTETTRHRGWYLSEYERSKVAAERLVLQASSTLDVVVVNPSSVQGPGRATGTGRLFLSAARGRLPIALRTTISIVDIDDCARGHLLAAELGISGERYLLSGATLTVPEAIAIVAGVTGMDPRPWYVSPRALLPVAASLEVLSKVFRFQSPICRETVRVLAHGHSYDGSKASNDLGLGYTPLAATIDRTVEWFAREGLISGRN